MQIWKKSLKWISVTKWIIYLLKSTEIVARNLCRDSMMLPRAHVCCKSLGKSKGGKSIRSRTVLTNFVTIEDISTFIKNESVTKSDEHAYPRSNCVNSSQIILASTHLIKLFIFEP